jgi:hypothetical protein
MAATMSTKCITCPPSNFPKGFVCAGNTISVISDREALTGFPFNSTSPTAALFTIRLTSQVEFSAPSALAALAV